MNVFDDATAWMLAPHSRFPFVEKPFHTHTDFPWQSGVAVWQENIEYISDYDLQAIYPSPLRVPHNQTTGYGSGGSCGPALPSIDWINNGNLPLTYRCNEPYGFQEFHIKQTQLAADTGLLHAEWFGACQGFTCLWQRQDQSAANTSFPDAPKFTAFRFGVGRGPNECLYSVSHRGNGDVKIAKSYDGGNTWLDLATIAGGADIWTAQWGDPDPKYADGTIGAGDEPTAAPRTMNVLEVRLIAGRIAFRVGSQDRPYIFAEARVDENNNPIWLINKVAIRAYKFTALAFSGHPMKFRSSAYLYSQEIPIGFYSEDTAPPYIDPAGNVPPGWNAGVDGSISNLFGPIVSYALIMAGPVDGTYKGINYADTVAAIRAVSLFWRSRVYFNPAQPLYTEPEEEHVEHLFDPASLQVHSAGKLVYNNSRFRDLPTGQFDTWGMWMRNYGQVAMDLYMTRTSSSGGMGPWTRVFAGYGHTKGEVLSAAGASAFVMHLADRKRQLMNPRFALPWMDGWNVFYAIAYLAQLGGVDLSDMTFLPYIPPVPFGPGSDLGSPEGPSYYLPVGAAGSQLTRFSGVHLWEVMSKIAISIGYMLLFDVNGQLQFRKFTMPAGVKRTFYESDKESAIFQINGGMEGAWEMSSMKDMDEVRNTSIVAGFEAFAPLYNPVVFKYTDFDSIFDPNTFNHLGYENPAVWVDSQFASPGYAGLAAYEMFKFLRTPGFYVNLTTWLQPDIFPLDMIMVDSRRLGTIGLRFMVCSVRHSVTKNIGSSMIAARYIPEL